MKKESFLIMVIVLVLGVIQPGKAASIRNKKNPVGSDMKQHPVLACADYHIMRGNLKNTLFKIQKKKRIRVAFLGGSITNMRGWRAMLCSYLQNRFPAAEFNFVQAGIPSMGSTSDAFRMERDVVYNGPVDLLFVEAAVNDNRKDKTDDEIVKGMEGIVRHARYVSADTDIVFMYFADQDKIADYKQGKVPHVIADHEKVAKYYNIPVINLAKEITERISAGEITWKKDFKSVHPARPGQRIYVRSMINFLENMWKTHPLASKDRITAYVMPQKLNSGCYDRGYFIAAWQMKPTKAWEYVETWNPEFKAGTRRNYFHVPMLIGKYPADTYTLKFKGNAVGIVAVCGPDEGIIEYRIDKGPWKTQDLFTKHSRGLYLPWYYTLGLDLESGQHELQIKLSSQKNPNSKGRTCHLRYVYVNR